MKTLQNDIYVYIHIFFWVRLKFLWNDSIRNMPNAIPKDVVFSARRKLIKQKWFCLYVVSVRGLNKHLKCNVILYHSACIVGYRKHLLSSAGIYLPSILSSVCGIVTSSLFDYFIQHSIFFFFKYISQFLDIEQSVIKLVSSISMDMAKSNIIL